MGDFEAEVEAQCAKLCKRIGDDLSKSVCYMMAGLSSDLVKVRQAAENFSCSECAYGRMDCG